MKPPGSRRLPVDRHRSSPFDGDRFFFGMGATMLILTAIGFAPTFYLAPLFDAPRLPIHLVLHGGIFTLWMVTFLVQALLIRRREIRLHRRLGLAAGGLAFGMVVSGLVVLYHVGRGFEGPLPFVTSLVWGNLALLAAFSTFTALGLLNRRRPAAHKRLMLLASLSMMGQPLSRIGQLGFLRISDVRGVNDLVYGLGGVFLLLTFVVARDLRARDRVHPVFAIGAPAFLATLVLFGAVIPGTGFGQALILRLR